MLHEGEVRKTNFIFLHY